MPVIPAAFDYHRPGSVADAVGLIVRLGEEARVLAGGHSLIPMMKLRMAAPEHLIDLAGIAEIAEIAVEGDRATIGAMVTQHALIAHEGLAQAVPLLREAAVQIATRRCAIAARWGAMSPMATRRTTCPG